MLLNGITMTVELRKLLEEHSIKCPESTINSKTLDSLQNAIVSKDSVSTVVADHIIRSAMKGGKLSFARSSELSGEPSTTTSTITDAQEQNRRRRVYLRKKAEERAYNKLTKNLPKTKKHDPSQTLSANKFVMSVGLNMIVAPVSFGVFVYSFSSFMFDEGREAKNARVICGVLSGVAMLFVEMLLFIIRSDSMINAKPRRTQRYEN